MPESDTIYHLYIMTLSDDTDSGLFIYIDRKKKNNANY